MDDIDATILHSLQFDFPLTTRPFASIGRIVKTSEEEVLRRIAELKRTGVIRQISAIFDSAKIGYHGVLVAFKVPKEKLDAVAGSLNQNPGISHNYVRDNEFNLWFTLTLPDSSDLKREAEELARIAGVKEWLFLPTIKRYKISFQLAMGKSGTEDTLTLSPRPVASLRVVPLPLAPWERGRGNGEEWVRAPSTFDFSKPFIRELQKDLPLVSRPYRSAASALNMTEGRVVAEVERYIAAGAMRRMAAVLRPRDSGYTANILTVWAPPAEKKELLGRVAANHKEVSHCYERPSFPNWPYSIYTMIHGRSTGECREAILQISDETGVTTWCELPTVREYKKIRVEYYREGQGDVPDSG